MTDYWHSFAAPQPRDLEEHLPSVDIFIPSSVVSTSSTIPTSSAPTSCSSRTIVETGSLLKSSVRSASEQGLLLAQRSKTSLNRLLDTVLDNATTLAESSSANCAYSDSEDKPSLPTATPALRTAPSQPRQPARAKFFVCDSDEESDDEEEEEEEAYFFPRRSEDNFGDCEDSGTDEAETEEEGLPTTNTSSLQSAPGTVRRQSLLSDLFMAEKQREQFQQPSKPIRPSMARTCSTYSSRCPSAANSDGESTFSRMTPVPEVYQDRGHHHHHQHYPHHTSLDAEDKIQEPEKPKSPLVRTKRVFKNLDELASLSMSPTCNISSPSSASPTSSIASTSTSPATALAAWTRSHQVQVQIQSLVVQSSSSAQRALLSASATLTDVLFRTK